MNDLDQKIAETKGWEWDAAERMVWTDPPFETVVYGEKTSARRGLIMSACCWSTSDAEAFELVDEVAEPLFFIERYGKSGDKRWKAHFAFGQRITYFDEARGATVSIPDVPKDIFGEGPTRPEAICRAYLAAMEYMKGKKG